MGYPIFCNDFFLPRLQLLLFKSEKIKKNLWWKNPCCISHSSYTIFSWGIKIDGLLKKRHILIILVHCEGWRQTLLLFSKRWHNILQNIRFIEFYETIVHYPWSRFCFYIIIKTAVYSKDKVKVLQTTWNLKFEAFVLKKYL